MRLTPSRSAIVCRVTLAIPPPCSLRASQGRISDGGVSTGTAGPVRQAGPCGRRGERTPRRRAGPTRSTDAWRTLSDRASVSIQYHTLCIGQEPDLEDSRPAPPGDLPGLAREPLLVGGGGQAGAFGGNQGALPEPGAEVPGFGVDDDVARVLAQAQGSTDELVEPELLGPRDLDDAVGRRADADLAQGGGHVVGGHGLDEHRSQAHR